MNTNQNSNIQYANFESFNNYNDDEIMERRNRSPNYTNQKKGNFNGVGNSPNTKQINPLNSSTKQHPNKNRGFNNSNEMSNRKNFEAQERPRTNNVKNNKISGDYYSKTPTKNTKFTNKNDTYLLDNNTINKNKKTLSKSPLNIKSDAKSNRYRKQNIDYQLDDFLTKDRNSTKNQRNSIGN